MSRYAYGTIIMTRHWLRVAALGVLLAAGAGQALAGDYVWKDGKWVPAAKPAEGTPAGELALIRLYVDKHERRTAVAAVEKFCKAHADDPACEEAMLLGAQAELDAGRYFQAWEALEKMVAKYPSGDFLERALMREMDVANAFLAGKKRVIAGFIYLPAEDEGITILRKVAEHAPGSEIAETALLRIGEYRFDNREFAESAEAYDNYLQLFPKSVRAPYAMVQAARAMYASFRGVAYDEMPLIEAEQRYKILLDQYPAAAKKARAAEILKEINDLRAQRTYETAKFYTRVSRPEAAKYYYRQVADQYSSSRWAGDARASLGSSYKPPTTAPSRPTTAPAIKIEPRDGPEIAPSPKVEPKPAPAAPVVAPQPKVEPKPAPAVTTQPKAEPKPAPAAPVVAPAPAPAPAPKAEPTSKPAPGATSIPAPIDLEKLAEPKPKGGK